MPWSSLFFNLVLPNVCASGRYWLNLSSLEGKTPLMKESKIIEGQQVMELRCDDELCHRIINIQLDNKSSWQWKASAAGWGISGSHIRCPEHIPHIAHILE